MQGRFIIFFLLIDLISLKISKAQQFQEITNLMNFGDLKYNNGHAVADYDRDGDLDVFVVARNSYSEHDSTTWSRLYRNNGDNTFTDVTIVSGFQFQYANPGEEGSEGQKMGATWGDYNNDGYPDLLLTHYRKIELYLNNGKGSFTDVTTEAGISECFTCYNSSALWWDYDKDGDLDLYLSDWKEANRLYQNQGNGTFTDKTAYTNLGDLGNTWTSIPIDANRDGWPDLYVANDFFRNKFYLNMNGDYFMEATTAYGLEDYGNGMGITVGDYNNDGFFDIYLTNIYEYAPNPLFTSTSSGVFKENAAEMGVENAGWAWGASFFDADLDGDEDLYVVNGHEDSHHSNKFFKNMWIEGSFNFRDWSEISLADGRADAMSLTTFDFDDDGDLDMLVSNTDSTPYFYQNRIIQPDKVTENSWLKVQLEGTLSNRDGLGTIVRVKAQGKSFYRYYHGAGLLSQNLLPVHFGLGTVPAVDTLMITWPNSPQEVFYGIQVNQTVKVIEQQEIILQKQTTVTSLHDGIRTIPDDHVKPNPNPFTHFTLFEFTAPKGEKVTLNIFSIGGLPLYTFPANLSQDGIFRIEWDGSDGKGLKLPSGIYLYKLTVGEKQHIGKIILTR